MVLFHVALALIEQKDRPGQCQQYQGNKQYRPTPDVGLHLFELLSEDLIMLCHALAAVQDQKALDTVFWPSYSEST
jgi:hypothetical protein